MNVVARGGGVGVGKGRDEISEWSDYCGGTQIIEGKIVGKKVGGDGRYIANTFADPNYKFQANRT